jgi:predicted HAD superfamily Cof-like phosphohydrolase
MSRDRAITELEAPSVPSLLFDIIKFAERVQDPNFWRPADARGLHIQKELQRFLDRYKDGER